MDGFFVPPAMLRYYTPNPTIRRAITEYEDEDESTTEEERLTGHYAQAEYDNINRFGS